MKSIQTKFIILILSCVLLSSIVIGGAGILNSKRVIDADSAQIMNALCSERAQELDSLLSRIEQSVKTLAVYTLRQIDSIGMLKDPDSVETLTDKLEEIALNAANNTDGAMAVYVRYNPVFTAPTSGLFWSKTTKNDDFQQLTPTDFSMYSPSDTEHVGWYYLPVENGKATWMAPYMNQNINVRMISYVIPLYMHNTVIGVVGMDINFNVLSDTVKNMKIYRSGYAFLADEEGKIVYHNDIAFGTPMENTDKSLIPVVNELENGSSGSSLFPYDWHNVKKKMAFRSLSNTMRLVISAPVAEIDAAKNALILQVGVAMGFILVISFIFTVQQMRRIVKPLQELTAAAKKIADGDFTIDIAHRTDDEIGILADSFRQTVNHLHKYIDYINGLAYRDSLTGVKNKTAYQDAVRKMEERMRVGRPEFAVVVFDINGLKQVNDTCGHDFGDMLIIEACKLLCMSFKHSPVFRIGGDEFVTILENADLEHYKELLERFQKIIDEYNQHSAIGNKISIARGIAIYSDETDLIFANVFKRADDAMYQNKAAMKEIMQR